MLVKMSIKSRATIPARNASTTQIGTSEGTPPDITHAHVRFSSTCVDRMPPGAGNPFGDYSSSLLSLAAGAITALTGIDGIVAGVSSTVHHALAGLGVTAFTEGGVPSMDAGTMKQVAMSVAGGMLVKVIQ